ncbi:MAG TPA: hypothetical protein VN661_09170 [Candidatus Acidoferrales bacterium]|nr:hypothetical protein [Candidatus Acidoferrales bacterium]
MKSSRKIRGGRAEQPGAQAGYAYLMALFFIALVLIGSMTAISNASIEGKREHEEQMIWRGNDCARAIRLYYRKTGHYPQNIDDLEKGIPGVHFLRYSAYKDPMNKSDGSWRFIYVNAAGSLVGSVRYATLQQMAILELNHGQWPAPAGSDSDSGQSGGSGQLSQSGQGQQGASARGAGQQGGMPAGPALAALGQLKPTGAVDGPVIGGFLTGVASKVDRASLKVYDGGTRYNQWEFIWNPIEDQMRALQQAQNQMGGLGLGGGVGMGGSQSGAGGMNLNFHLNGPPGGTPAGGAGAGGGRPMPQPMPPPMHQSHQLRP